MLRFSTNLTAEMVGLSATISRTGQTTSLAASARAMNRWAESRYGARGINLVDHSGLGDKSRMTADAMVRVLMGAHKSATLEPILRTIPMRDAKNRIVKSHPIKVAAKTGTLNFVSSLAGYMRMSDGRAMAFAIFAADEAARARVSRANREAPRGARGWNGRAKAMHQRLIQRWGQMYGS